MDAIPEEQRLESGVSAGLVMALIDQVKENGQRVTVPVMLTASWLLCRTQHAPERLGYGVLWALMVLLMNMHDVSESVAGLAIALLTLMVCSSAGERVKRFWPRHFFVMFYAVHLAVLGIVVSM